MKYTIKYDDKIIVWGCFSTNGTGILHKIDGIMDRWVYKKILRYQMINSSKQLFPNGDFIFQQDNDPKHTTGIVKNYLNYKDFNAMIKINMNDSLELITDSDKHRLTSKQILRKLKNLLVSSKILLTLGKDGIAIYDDGEITEIVAIT